MTENKPSVFSAEISTIGKKPVLSTKDRIISGATFECPRQRSTRFEVDTINGDIVSVYIRRNGDIKGEWEKWSMRDMEWAFDKGEYSFTN